MIIYNKNTLKIECKILVLDKESFNKNKKMYFPTWDDNTYIATEIEYKNPILENGFLREKTREELILIDCKTELLKDGEVVEDSYIVVVPVQEGLFMKKWVSPNWIEGANQEQIRARIIEIEDKLMELKANINFRLVENYFVEEKQLEYANLEAERNNLLTKLA